MDDLRPGIYQHYKGLLYLALGIAFHQDAMTGVVLGQARHSESGDFYEVYTRRDNGQLCARRHDTEPDGRQFALYVPKYLHKGPGMAIRPLAMFQELVTIEGQEVPVQRFRYLGHEIPYIEQEREPVLGLESEVKNAE
jgi:hypothetical protein